MRIVLRCLAALVVTVCLGPPVEAQPTTGTLYSLTEQSDQEIGCFDPCMCPVLMRGPVTGTFRLTSLGFDGLFHHYAVSVVQWLVPRGSDLANVVGSGRYKVGGELAVQHQMTLDLAIDDGEIQRFDSGLIPGGQTFPKIDVAVAVNGFFCWDTTFTLLAVPATTALSVSEEPIELTGRPNPFFETIQIELILPSASRVRVTVHDVRGRSIRTLARASALGPGPLVLAWDGRSEQGEPMPPGLYFVRAVLEDTGRTETRPVVRIGMR